MRTFMQINFTQRGAAPIWRPKENKSNAHNCHKTFGLKIYHDWAVGLDLYGILRLLSFPRQLRQQKV